jgi:hypothetical protein
MNTKSNMKNWDDHLNEKYGKAGTEDREKFEEDFEAFRIRVLSEDPRKWQK